MQPAIPPDLRERFSQVNCSGLLLADVIICGWKLQNVAQSCTLLYRRILFCGAHENIKAINFINVLQIKNLRYSSDTAECNSALLRSALCESPVSRF